MFLAPRLAIFLLLTGFGAGRGEQLNPSPMQGYGIAPEVLVSTNEDGGALRCEPSVAIAGDNIVVAWNDSWGGSHGSSTGVAVAWAYSRDGGKTFSFGGYLPETATEQPPAAADSQIVADGEGNFYLEILSWQKGSHTIFLYFMDHKNIGVWQRHSRAVSVNTSHSAFLDRPFLSIDQSGILTMAFTMGSGNDMRIGLAVSLDRGLTWSAPREISEGPVRARTGASTARVGDAIFVAWFEGGDGTSVGELWYAVSTDTAKTFSKPELLYKESRPLGTIPGYVMGLARDALFSLANYTTLVATGEDASQLALVSTDRNASGLSVILFRWDRSKMAWSNPINVNQGMYNGSSFLPGLARFESSVAIVRYYRENVNAPGVTDVFLTICKGDVMAHIKLNAVPSDWTRVVGDKEHAPIQRNFGDYLSVAASGRRIAAVWTDGRNGRPRIYCRVVEKFST